MRNREYVEIEEVGWRIGERKGKWRDGYGWELRDGGGDWEGVYL